MRRSWVPLFAAAFAVAMLDSGSARAIASTTNGDVASHQLHRELELGRASGVRQARAWSFERR